MHATLKLVKLIKNRWRVVASAAMIGFFLSLAQLLYHDYSKYQYVSEIAFSGARPIYATPEEIASSVATLFQTPSAVNAFVKALFKGDHNESKIDWLQLLQDRFGVKGNVDSKMLEAAQIYVSEKYNRPEAAFRVFSSGRRYVFQLNTDESDLDKVRTLSRVVFEAFSEAVAENNERNSRKIDEDYLSNLNTKRAEFNEALAAFQKVQADAKSDYQEMMRAAVALNVEARKKHPNLGPRVETPSYFELPSGQKVARTSFQIDEGKLGSHLFKTDAQFFLKITEGATETLARLPFGSKEAEILFQKITALQVAQQRYEVQIYAAQQIVMQSEYELTKAYTGFLQSKYKKTGIVPEPNIRAGNFPANIEIQKHLRSIKFDWRLCILLTLSAIFCSVFIMIVREEVF